ncbi:shikimate dehydrogenase [Secundilactobacillus folii]|uniref:Shikimate dehydrogenase (NADP(+)) n=1 Tax=Secundilactobacillus folii TaxID=2678357 RepID=A0A7X2XX61_9LACO|nr:shikimate dehydrogenase [Secundilactobacillus folii]MTV83180.1 shikimate dehydrogenase [Secundilactobacillus folii]
MVDAHTSLYGLMANPATHSLSPVIYNTTFQELGLNSVYLAFNVTPDHFDEAAHAIRALPIRGINLSMPYKQTIMAALDEIRPTAKQLNAVNTVINRDGYLVGDNTDGEGFVKSLQEAEVSVNDKQVAVLGAGGAGRAVILATAQAGANVTVFKRQNDTFEAIKSQVTGWSPHINVVPYEDEGQMKKVLAAADVVVNTTNVGMAGDQHIPVSQPVLKVLHPGQLVADVIYAPLETPFLARARLIGCQTMNGIGMLVHQAAGAFQRWTNQQMPIETVKNVIQQQLEE